MTTAISPALKAHYASGTTTLAQCWKCTRTDGTVFGFTNADIDINFEGLTYKAATGFTASALDTKSDLSVDNMEVMGRLEGESLTSRDINAGRWDDCQIDIFEVNYKDLTMGKRDLPSGKIGNVSYGGSSYTAELRGKAQQLQTNIGEVYSPTCRAQLGDSKCKVNLAAWTVTGAVTSVADQRTFTDSSRAEPANWFNNGKITFTSGLNIGVSMEVKTFASGLITLQLPMPFTVAIGDTYALVRGCNKVLLGDCKLVFANVINFRGEPWVPGNDSIMKIGGQ